MRRHPWRLGIGLYGAVHRASQRQMRFKWVGAGGPCWRLLRPQRDAEVAGNWSPQQLVLSHGWPIPAGMPWLPELTCGSGRAGAVAFAPRRGGAAREKTGAGSVAGQIIGWTYTTFMAHLLKLR